MATRVTDGARWERHEKREKKGKTPSHAGHPARSTALVQTSMDQSETLLLFFAETNQRQSCSRVPQSSRCLSSTCAEELRVEIASHQDKQTAAELPKKGKFETLKGFGGLKTYLQAEKSSVSNSKRKISSSSLRKTRSLTEIVVGE